VNEQVIYLLQQILEQAEKQTGLLETIASQNLALIEALADEGGVDPDAPPQTYLSGAPCR